MPLPTHSCKDSCGLFGHQPSGFDWTRRPCLLSQSQHLLAGAAGQWLHLSPASILHPLEENLNDLILLRLSFVCTDSWIRLPYLPQIIHFLLWNFIVLKILLRISFHCTPSRIFHIEILYIAYCPAILKKFLLNISFPAEWHLAFYMLRCFFRLVAAALMFYCINVLLQFKML